MRVARSRTCRGQILSGTYLRIPLDRMEPTICWRVTEFQVSSGQAAAAAFDASTGLLTTEEPGLTTWAAPGQFNYADNRQIGWARDNCLDSAADNGVWNLVDEDNLISEDLFVVVWNRTADPGYINYYIRLEMVHVNLNENLFATVRSKSQDVP